MAEISNFPNAGEPYAPPTRARRKQGDLGVGSASNLLWTCYLIAILFGNILFGRGLVSGDGNPMVQVVFTGIAAGSILLLFLTNTPKRNIIPFLFIVMLIWVWASLGWASVPGVAWRRSTMLTITVLTVFSLARLSGPTEALQICCRVMVVMIIVDIVFSVAIPGHTQGPSWKGVHGDKNAAGALAAIAVILLIYKVATTVRSQRWTWIGCTLLAIAFLGFTISKTSIAVTPVAMCLGLVFVMASRSKVLSYVLAAIGIALPVTVMWNIDSIVVSLSGILDDPAALTGRTQIWPPLVEFIRTSPWLGSGYGSFWQLGPVNMLSDYADGWVLDAPTAHNGYIDLWVQTGAIGFVIAVLAVIWPLIRTVTARDIPLAQRWLVASIICFTLMHNILETSLFEKANPQFVIVMLCISLLGRPGASQRSKTSDWEASGSGMGDRHGVSASARPAW